MAEAQFIDKDLKCGVCLSRYTEPRILTCYHIFCTPCLEKLMTMDTNTIMCPLCKREIILQHEGIQGFELYPVNYTSENCACQLCSDESLAVSKCLDCNINLCGNCCEYHGKLKASKDHKLEHFGSKQSYIESNNNECGEHKKELSIFCKPCNQLICSECRENRHAKHKVEKVINSAKYKRDILSARMASLTCKIQSMENCIEIVKMEENSYCKQSAQIKQKILGHATGLKAIFCKTIDIFAREKIDLVDDICKKGIKLIQTYSDELETRKMSAQSMLTTADHLVNKYTDVQIVSHFHSLRTQLDHFLQEPAPKFLQLHGFQYKRGNLEQQAIRDLVGEVECETKSEEIQIESSGLSVPDLASNVLHLSSFEISEKVLGMVPSDDDDRVWIFTEDSMSLHGLDGSLISSYTPPDNSTKVMRKSNGEIWFWVGNGAEKGKADGQEGYQVPFEGGVGCCFLQNGNMLVFNPEDKSINEVTEQNGVHRKIINENLQTMLDDDIIINIVESKNEKNLVISSKPDTIIVADINGCVKNTYEIFEANFKAFAVDNYGDIIVADYENNVITMLSERGDFKCDLLNEARNDLSGIEDFTLDKCGNIWFLHNSDSIEIYSYL